VLSGSALKAALAAFSKCKEQSSKSKDGIACGDGLRIKYFSIISKKAAIAAFFDSNFEL
jgi:hypothetical protein